YRFQRLCPDLSGAVGVTKAGIVDGAEGPSVVPLFDDKCGRSRAECGASPVKCPRRGQEPAPRAAFCCDTMGMWRVTDGSVREADGMWRVTDGSVREPVQKSHHVPFCQSLSPLFPG